jgi:hypothetical protein
VTARIPFGRRKLRRVKSQERCRRETKPARCQREKAVKRVTKPCRRNVAGRQNPRQVDLRHLKCCRERKPMRAADWLRLVGKVSLTTTQGKAKLEERVRLAI